MKQSPRHGFSLLELLVVMTIIGVLAGLILPAINNAQNISGRSTCSNHIRQMGLAVLEYEQTYKRLPSLNCTWGYGGYDAIPFWDVAKGYGGAGRWSGVIALLPYMEQSALYKEFDEGANGRLGNRDLCWGPYGSIADKQTAAKMKARQDVLRYPWSPQYKPNRTQVNIFRCPQEPSTLRSISSRSLARTNYAFCLGDGQVGLNSGDPTFDSTRGAFQLNLHHPIAAITDGTANTLMFGEIATPESTSFAVENQGATEKDAKVQGKAVYELPLQADLRGVDVMACRALVNKGQYVGTKRNWANLGARAYDAMAAYTGFITVNPPNAGSCTPTDNAWGEGEGIYTLSSHHLGGAHVVTFDCSVKFVNEGINTDDLRTGTVATEYYSPGRAWVNGKVRQTPNWTAPSAFGVWGAMGTRSGCEYPNSHPLD